jgi:hypothetical protein
MSVEQNSNETTTTETTTTNTDSQGTTATPEESSSEQNSSEETALSQASKQKESTEGGSQETSEPESESTETEESAEPTSEETTTGGTDDGGEEGGEEGYDLELSDDSPLEQEDLDAVAEIASANGLNKEQADSMIKKMEASYAKGMNVSQAKLEGFKSELMKDPDFIGDKGKESFFAIHKAAKTFGDENLDKALNDPYIGNNVHLARFLKKVGEQVSNDNFVGKGGSGDSSGLTEHQQALRNAYPEMFKEE